jgi:hypothetical protein
MQMWMLWRPLAMLLLVLLLVMVLLMMTASPSENYPCETEGGGS